MNVTQDLSFVHLISNASLLVQLVMALLALVSIMSWTYIFRKMFAIRNARAQTDEFERLFWSGGNLDALYQDATSSRRQYKNDSGALERIFESGMSEFNKARAIGSRADAQGAGPLEGARRAMRAAYQRASLGLIDNWLRHIQDVRDRHESRLDPAGNLDTNINRLCELNVIDQVRNVCQTTIVQEAWARGQPLTVHGWIYDIHDGLLQDLRCTVTSAAEVVPIHQQSLEYVVGARTRTT